MDDLQIIEQVINGNRQAFASLVQRYQQPLFHYLGRMRLPAAEAEELVQETFIRAFRHLRTFEPQRACFSTWLFTIARRLALNHLAHRRREIDNPSEIEPADSANQPDQDYHRGQIEQRINTALAQLPLKYLSPLALAYLGELSVAEIALIEDCAEGTVKSRIFRGKQRLKLLLADLLGEDDHA